MNNKDLIKLLESMKDDPELGGGFDADTTWQRVASRCGFDQDAKPRRYAFREYMEYLVWQGTHVMIKPVAASLAVFLIAITGWVSAANISANALPGDALYPVKIGMEQAQLKLAFSGDQRAALQVEFASRRLDEMVKLASLNGDKTEELQLAVAKVKTQVESINESLSQDTNGSATELAKAVSRKVETYKETVSESKLPEEVMVQVQEVQDILDDTQEQVVDVIITAHELTEDKEAEHELEITFENELERIQEQYGETAAEQIEIAVTLKEEGAYRRAFQVLREIELPVVEEVVEPEEESSF